MPGHCWNRPRKAARGRIFVDHAVSLVQAYLQLNGYFTSAEYPVVELRETGGFRNLTDIDILAFRFPAQNPVATGDLRPRNIRPTGIVSEVDPGLGVPADRIDMIIGEVKEGRVGINSGATDPAILRTVINRFGYVSDGGEEMVQEILRTGSVITASGYQIRLVAFGAFPPGAEVPPCRIISLGHVLRYLQDYVRRHWSMLRQVQFKDPAFGFLMTLEKARRGGAGRRGQEGVEVVPERGSLLRTSTNSELRGTGNGPRRQTPSRPDGTPRPARRSRRSR